MTQTPPLDLRYVPGYANLGPYERGNHSLFGSLGHWHSTSSGT